MKTGGGNCWSFFSLGVGNYSEDDIREAARAFTGWTIAPKIPRNPYGRFHWQFEYKPEDHDDREKTFLGYTGNFNGEDIVDIIVDQPATAPVSWPATSTDSSSPTSPLSPVGTLHHPLTLKPSSCWWMPTMNPVATSGLFCEHCSTQSSSIMPRFARVKSPAELIVGTVRMAGNYNGFKPGFNNLALECSWQGQELLNPPSVEGWHTGSEWIDPGVLMRRVNFASRIFGDISLPGVQAIIKRVVGECAWGSFPPGDSGSLS